MTALSLFLHLLAIAGGLLAVGAVLLLLLTVFLAILGTRTRSRPPSVLPLSVTEEQSRH